MEKPTTGKYDISLVGSAFSRWIACAFQKTSVLQHPAKPLVVDPFAGGGSIPIEALRVGADAFASDLNPVAVLLNKVVLEYIPKYGQRLADEVRKWGQWIKDEAEKELAQFYPKDPDGSTPIAYLWARAIKCEGPGCGAEVPLLGRSIIAKRKSGAVALLLSAEGRGKQIKVEIVDGKRATKTTGTCRGFVATCPRTECGFSTPKKDVQKQLTAQRGGAHLARLLAVLTDGPAGRRYRLPCKRDLVAFAAASDAFRNTTGETLVPDEPIPPRTAHRAVGSQLPLYGFKTWADVFNPRQKLALTALQKAARLAYQSLISQSDQQFARAAFLLLAFALDKQVDYSSSLCRWVSRGEFIAGTLAGEKKLPMISDFAEGNPIGSGSGSWENQIDWISRFIEKEANSLPQPGVASQSSADEETLPSDSTAAMITDPPYYDSVPYADLSDFFYVWLKRTVSGIEADLDDLLTPKDREMTVNHPHDEQEISRYRSLLTKAFKNGRRETARDGIAVIVFAHKSTSGWEALLESIVGSGWIVTASWPVDTERSARLNALETASLASSVHIICRPQTGVQNSLQSKEIGDWRDILSELPTRIHEWMPRLSTEGVVGADAIFACLGPALEIFSRYTRVEKASGDQVTLKEYLEYVWAAVAKEALNMIFEGADATGFEEDARLTAMWLWTLSTGTNGKGPATEASEVDEEEEEAGTKKAKLSGYMLEYDAARKIAQGLGAHLERLTSLVEVSGETARLLPASERARHLFGKDEGAAPTKRKAKPKQLSLLDELGEMEEESGGWGEKSAPKAGNTVLDRVHQSMILFAAGRNEAMKRFLVTDGAGSDPRFWHLADALCKLYPSGTDERRWVEGVMARKKGLGF